MRRARIGVIGSVVEDTIDRPGEATVRDMGGGYHSIIAMSVLLPAEFEALPIVNVGETRCARPSTGATAAIVAQHPRRAGDQQGPSGV
jgi:hypothetical protein